MPTFQKISNHLWFAHEAEEAAEYYTAIFKNSSIDRIARYGKAGFDQHKMPDGSVMTVEFTIEGQQFIALNGGPIFKFNESISFMINCDTQEEIDYYWEGLKAGGPENAQHCGWLKDKFGVSWQVAPVQLSDMMVSEDIEKKERAIAAMMNMKKLDLKQLQKAFNGK
jgi:predicted 3-demethylubiquinone-9 3-methyltransferase (glyoxalase superfamily)